MKANELISDYLNDEITAIETIRILSGIFDPKDSVDLLALINQISRIELGDSSLKNQILRVEEKHHL